MPLHRPYTLPYFAPDLDQIEIMARAALETVPKVLRDHVHDVVIRVEDFPDDDVMREMNLESPFDILGLYRGIPINGRGSGLIASDIDMIFLYRRPILDYWSETGEELSDIIRHVLIHEIGHHFGLSDEDMERIEAAG